MKDPQDEDYVAHEAMAGWPRVIFWVVIVVAVAVGWTEFSIFIRRLVS
jgi:hypothetical protein